MDNLINMDAYQIFTAFILTLLASLSLPMNILALVVLRRTRGIEPATRVFLVSLTVADVGMCIGYVLPAVGVSIVGGWPYGKILCLIQAFAMDPVSQTIYVPVCVAD